MCSNNPYRLHHTEWYVYKFANVSKFPNPAPTMAPHPMPISSGQNQQPNHPYETKYRLLMNILMKIRNYRKIDVYLLENLITIALEIIKNSSNIFEGNHLADYVCQIENINVYFDMGLGSLREDGTECQAKCLELLKYCMHTMSTVDQNEHLPKNKVYFGYDNEILKAHYCNESYAGAHQLMVSRII